MVGENAVSVFYKLPDGTIKERMVYRDEEPSLTLAKSGLAWSFDSPGKEFKLVLEALRIQTGFAFDPLMASLLDYMLVTKRQLLKTGTVMVDPNDDGVTPSLLFMIDHSVCEGEAEKLVSRRMQFVRLLPDGKASSSKRDSAM